MKVLVTGGAGFVGSHLVERLIEEKVGQIYVMDDLSNGYTDNLSSVKDKITFIKHDVTKPFFATADVIFHLACHPRSFSLVNPWRDLSVNVESTINLLSLAVKTGSKIIFSSNSGIYDTSRIPIDETTPDKPTTPYDIDKLASEWYLRAYSNLYNVNCTVFRFATVYGERQRVNESYGWEPLVATFCRNAVRREPLRIDGEGKQTRDLIYVEDIVDALTLSIHHNTGSEPMILGTGVETSVYDIAKCISNLSGMDESMFRHAPRKDGDIQRMQYNCQKAQKVLGWKAKTDLENGLKKTFEWWKGQK